MLISGLRLDVIRVSVTEIPSLRLGLIFVISIVTVVASNCVTCARLRKRTSVIIRLRGSLMRLALAVMLILMLKLLITLKPWRFALLHVASAVLLRIRGGTVARGSSAVPVFFRMSRRRLIPAAAFLIPVVKVNMKKRLERRFMKDFCFVYWLHTVYLVRFAHRSPSIQVGPDCFR